MKGRQIAPGSAEGEALVTSEPLGFYGGVDPKSGEVIDKNHELCGENVKGKILMFPKGKGSTVGSYVIYGLMKYGNAPAAIINSETETIVAVGVILSGIPCIDGIDINKFKSGEKVRINADEAIIERL
jgi:predicted aconitase with swiveling domain